MATVGDRIFYYRRRIGMTQEELAEKMGYKSKSTINKIEKGINDIPQRQIARFAEVLCTTPAHLMGWITEEQKNPPVEENDLNEGEKLLLDLFRQIPADKQELVLQMIRVALGKQ